MRPVLPGARGRLREEVVKLPGCPFACRPLGRSSPAAVWDCRGGAPCTLPGSILDWTPVDSLIVHPPGGPARGITGTPEAEQGPVAVADTVVGRVVDPLETIPDPHVVDENRPGLGLRGRGNGQHGPHTS